MQEYEPPHKRGILHTGSQKTDPIRVQVEITHSDNTDPLYRMRVIWFGLFPTETPSYHCSVIPDQLVKKLKEATRTKTHTHSEITSQPCFSFIKKQKNGDILTYVHQSKRPSERKYTSGSSHSEQTLEEHLGLDRRCRRPCYITPYSGGDTITTVLFRGK